MPYFGQFGIAGMTVFLIGPALLTFCRLYLEPPHRSVYGHHFSVGTLGGSWPLGATVWRWFHKRYSTGLAGMSLIDYVVKLCNLSFVPTLMVFSFSFCHFS